MEHGSKNRNGGFFLLHVDNKEVSIFTNPTASQRCLVSLLGKYFSKIPEKAKKADTFYCRPLDKFRDDGPWYSVQPRGKHALSEMVKRMCNEAGLDGNFTNHSLRASGATQLFQNDIPEKVIQEVTGHRSTKALRQYERVAIQQKQVASNILTSGSSSKELYPQPKGNIPGPPSLGFPMPVLSSVFSGHGGTVNFTVNICPSGNISVGCNDTEKTYEKLFEGIELEDLQ